MGQTSLMQRGMTHLASPDPFGFPNHTGGTGHLYQGPFKSFPCQSDEHFLTVCRYVERNALSGNLVTAAEDWQYGSLHRWH